MNWASHASALKSDFPSKRKTTRSLVWSDIKAKIQVLNLPEVISQFPTVVSGDVINIGSAGMFLKTNVDIPFPAMVQIDILFDANCCQNGLSLTATGKVVRRTNDGLGIEFIQIDLSRLQKCIISRINQ